MAQVDPEMQELLARNLQYPDVEAVVKRLNAKKDLVDLYISDIVKHSKYRQPHAFMDLEYALTASASAAAKAEMDGVPEDRIEMLRRFSSQVAFELEKLAPPPMPQPMIPGMEAPPVAPAMPQEPLQ
jgi:hypothetical protein